MSVVSNPTWRQLADQAPGMARWLGIDLSIIHSLVQRHGSDKAAVAIFCILQLHDRIKRPGAYLRSLATGKHADKFDPMRWLRRLSSAVEAMPARKMA